MNNQRATRPASAPEVVSIADLAMFCAADDPLRRTDQVIEEVRKCWPFEVRAIDELAGSGVTINFADGSAAYFAAWK